MSLVERALKKLQETRGNVPPVSPAQQRAVATAQAQAQPVRAQALPHSSRIAKVDLAALRAIELLPAEREERRLMQEYRQIKRPLIANALGRGDTPVANGHVILVSSALPGDGKTFTTINLALSMALEKDVSVLLVDADVAKRHVSRVMNIADEPGLLDVLRDDSVDVESQIIDTDIPGLSLLPAGKNSATATEHLASARMEAIIKQLVANDPNRIVLLDSPPLLLTSESRALASVCGQVVLVVRSGATPQQAVLEALQMLGDGRTIGIVLNGGSEDNRRGYYGYYGEEDAEQKAP
jgi:exopolysaccharide/PEP-CTERM locus tyrosine autokinase